MSENWCALCLSIIKNCTVEEALLTITTDDIYKPNKEEMDF